MTVTLLFFIVIIAIALWWLLQQQLTAKPWLEEGAAPHGGKMGMLSFPAAQVGLWVLLAVMSSLFALLIGAYFMRSGFADWRPIQIPRLLWANTGALILSSVFLYGAQAGVNRKRMGMVRGSLLIGGGFGVAFVAGQLRAWDQLRAAGETVSLNPSDSFFYLLTGLHGLHVLGGLIVLGITADRVWRAAAPDGARLSVQLCATYWHFLLVVWLVLFALLTGRADELGRICRQLFS
jgi:cytochrome c oxidase subunit III